MKEIATNNGTTRVVHETELEGWTVKTLITQSLKGTKVYGFSQDGKRYGGCLEQIHSASISEGGWIDVSLTMSPIPLSPIPFGEGDSFNDAEIKRAIDTGREEGWVHPVATRAGLGFAASYPYTSPCILLELPLDLGGGLVRDASRTPDLYDMGNGENNLLLSVQRKSGELEVEYARLAELIPFESTLFRNRAKDVLDMLQTSRTPQARAAIEHLAIEVATELTGEIIHVIGLIGKGKGMDSIVPGRGCGYWVSSYLKMLGDSTPRLSYDINEDSDPDWHVWMPEMFGNWNPAPDDPCSFCYIRGAHAILDELAERGGIIEDIEWALQGWAAVGWDD